MLLGFSSGCLFRTHKRIDAGTFDIFRNIGCNSIELFCYEENELDLLLEKISIEDLKNFEYVSLHALSFRDLDIAKTRELAEKIKKICEKLPIKNIVFHPDGAINWQVLSDYSLPWVIENEDRTKYFGKTAEDMEMALSKIEAGIVLDLNHCFSNDPTMKLADNFIETFSDKIREIHLSGYETFHNLLYKTKQKEIISFVSKLDVPTIIESGCDNVEDVQKEFEYVKNNLK